MTNKTILILSLGASILAVSTPAFSTLTAEEPDVVTSYADLVYRNYTDAQGQAVTLQKAVGALLANPNEDTLRQARQAWLDSREPYGESEAFRFYEGPIDAADGPEGRLNSWPLNEMYIEGIIKDPSIAITKDSLVQKNQADDEADVATGYHAIEFLLWGQDLSLEGPGNRPVSDFTAGSEINDRRRAYLKAVTDLLVDDLTGLMKAWAPDQDNYAKAFKADSQTSVAHILTALATLSGFELASERMATALDSGDQEDEHSCFSDNTHNDFVYNARGVANVYFGRYGEYQGESLHALIRAKDPDLAAQIAAQLKETEMLVGTLPDPIDREILASSAGSPGREKMEAAVASLQKQAELFKQAGAALGLDVQIVSE